MFNVDPTSQQVGTQLSVTWPHSGHTQQGELVDVTGRDSVRLCFTGPCKDDWEVSEFVRHPDGSWREVLLMDDNDPVATFELAS